MKTYTIRETMSISDAVNTIFAKLPQGHRGTSPAFSRCGGSVVSKVIHYRPY